MEILVGYKKFKSKFVTYTAKDKDKVFESNSNEMTSKQFINKAKEYFKK